MIVENYQLIFMKIAMLEMFLRNPPSHRGSSGFRGTNFEYRCFILKMSLYRPAAVNIRAKKNCKYFTVSEQDRAVLVRVLGII